MIEVRNLVKNYGDFQAVRGISFSVEKGRILGFLGPNGAGKSTVMKMLTCYLPMSSGSASVAGFDCETQAHEVRRRLGYLPENNPLYTDLRVTESLDFVAQAKGLKGPRRAQAVDRAIQETQLGSVAGKLIAQLSKGYRQRVGLAQALVGDPEVLVLDEPTVGLDPAQIVEIRSLIKSLAGSRTVILSTHILPEVEAICDQVVIVMKGRVVEQDSLANLTRRGSGAERVRLVVGAGAEEARQFFGGLPGVQSVSPAAGPSGAAALDVDAARGSDLRPQLAAAAVGKGWPLLELRPQALGLEEIFLKLVAAEAAGREVQP